MSSPLLPVGIPSPVKGGKPPKMSARPFIGRALKLLVAHKALTAITVLLSLLVTLFPFVVSVAFAAIFQILGPVAGAKAPETASLWNLSAPLFGRSDTSWLASHGFGWVVAPLTLRTILIVWASALVLSQVLAFLRAWVVVHLESRLLIGIQRKIYDHLQSLSLDFFTSGQTGALMSRVLNEAGGVQRLLTQVLIYPVIDVVVLLIVLAYLLALRSEEHTSEL